MGEIETTFQEFLKATYTKGDPSAEQVRHLRYAFFGGVISTLTVGSTERAEKWLEECVAFNTEVKAGRL